MNKPVFILSLDCEGKWGVADHLTPDHPRTLGDASLQRAYRAIREVFDRYEVAATYAIVGLFGATRSHLDALDHRAVSATLPYARAAMDDLARGQVDGWHAPWLGEVIHARDEWALHGVTHTPFDQLDDRQVEAEFALLPDNFPAETFVYPRNRVAHRDRLPQHGVGGYRESLQRSRIANLAAEFFPFTAADAHPDAARDGEPIAIPAGQFVNWRSGPRNFVPRALSRLRARHLIEDAIARGGVAHYWTHPENVASAPATLENLEDVVALAAQYRDAGKIDILTQAQYCARLAERALAEG